MAAKISKFYREAAINLMSLNITDDSMFILIPSENDDQVYYRVDVSEETMQAERCSCRSYSYRQRCKHVQIVSGTFAGYTAPAPEPTPAEDVEVVESEPAEPKVTEIEAGQWYVVNSDSQVWKDAESGQWMAVGPTENAIEIVEAHLAVREAERIVASPIAQPEPTQEVSPVVRDYEIDMLRTALTSNSGFQLLKVS
jgi:hypothetical protein